MNNFYLKNNLYIVFFYKIENKYFLVYYYKMSQKISSEKEQIMNNVLGVNMTKWRTCFSSVSYYGYKLDILKSGVQKYLRRREFDKKIWCVAEIYLFQV